MGSVIDVNYRAICPADEFELVDSPGIRTRIQQTLTEADRPEMRRMLTPPVYYSLANGIDDNRAINDALLAAAKAQDGCRAIGVAEPKYGELAAAEIDRIAALGAAGIVWSPRAQGVFGNDRSLAELCIHAGRRGLVPMVHSAPYSINEGIWRIWALAEQFPDVPLVVLGGFESWEKIQFIRQHKGGGGNLYYDLSQLSETWDLDGLVQSLGAGRLLFGSGGGDLLERTLTLVERSSSPPDAKEAILYRNAEGLFA